MYLNKYDIKDETYVKLDELNDLLKSERKAIAQKMKQRHAEGDDNTGWAGAHSQITDFTRKVNMSEDGEKYVIFRRNSDGEWEYFMQLVKWYDIPAFVRKHQSRQRDEDYATVGTDNIDEATLYDCCEDAQDALAEIIVECPKQAKDWHVIKRWMFDTDDNRDSVLRLFYGGDKKDGDKAAAVKMAENAITRTRAALDRAEKALADVKDGESEKPSEAEPKTRTVMSKKGGKRCPARYTVWYRDDSDVTTHCMGFVRFENGHPLFTNHPCMATWFVWRDMAEKVAERCGEGFEVVDMIDQMTAEERLLRAIFREDGMDGDVEPEYHGDGTRAEDEDWDGDD